MYAMVPKDYNNHMLVFAWYVEESEDHFIVSYYFNAENVTDIIGITVINVNWLIRLINQMWDVFQI